MRITGKEWQQLTDQEAIDAQQNYANNYATDPAKLDFVIFGKRPVRQLLSVDGAKGLKIKSSLAMNEDTGNLQYFPILVAVDRFGNELPAPEEIEFDEEDDIEDRIQVMDDPSKPPVKCPVSCS